MNLMPGKIVLSKVLLKEDKINDKLIIFRTARSIEVLKLLFMKNQLQYLKNLCKLLLAVFFLFFLLRIIFLIFHFKSFMIDGFSDALWIFLGGMRFDISSILTINALLILLFLLPVPFRHNRIYQIVLKIVFIVFNSIGFLIYCLDIEYFDLYQRRLDYPSLTEALLKFSFSDIGYFLINHWAGLLIWFILLYFLLRFSRKISFSAFKINNPIGYFGIQILIFLIIMGLTLIGVRGGIQLKPIDIIMAGKYTTTQNFSLVTNNPFVFIKTMDKKKVKFTEPIKNERNFDPVIVFQNQPGSFTGENVIILILESYSKEFTGALNPTLRNHPEYLSYTPFLDSLIQKSLVCTDAYANDESSLRSLPNILSGIPSLMKDDYVSSIYTQNTINSIATKLGEKGYKCLFFHGGKNGTMNFDSYVYSVGFDEYYGLNEYPDNGDYDGKWGIFDEDYLGFFAKEVNKTFLGVFFSLSSHDPYKIPDQHKGKFPDGKLPIHKSAAYVDYSLKIFFNQIKKEAWYQNTLFVITADHGPRAVERYLPYYKNSMGENAIPIIYFKPDNSLAGKYPDESQQTDIFPTVMDLLNYEGKIFAYGQSIANRDSVFNSFSLFRNDGDIIFKDKFAIVYKNDKVKAVYDINNDSLCKTNLVNTGILDSISQDELGRAIINHYKKALVENKLTVQEN